jgi:hypothetical protein
MNEKIITNQIFNATFEKFVEIVETLSDQPFKKLKTNSYINEQEGYKYIVQREAKSKLLSKTWNKNTFGQGNITTLVNAAIQNKKGIENNLIDWRKKDNFKKIKPSKENEELLFNFFKSKIKNEIAFEKLHGLKFSYQFIAYLFFLREPQKFMPISQDRFDKIFNSLGIDFKTSRNTYWENYQKYNQIIKEYQNHLKIKFKTVSLLDAHSFLWIYGYQFDDKKAKILNKKKTVGNPIIATKDEENKKLKLYELKKIIPSNSQNSYNQTEEIPHKEIVIDYLEKHRKQIEIGNKAENIVLNSEREFLKKNNLTHLAKNVELVSDKPHLGYDILSFELDGRPKQIEVKAISNNRKNFFITHNELNKSQRLNNYYLYCVTKINSGQEEILRIKNPKFEDKNYFKIEPMSFKITFK